MVAIWYPTNKLAHILHSSTLEGVSKMLIDMYPDDSGLVHWVINSQGYQMEAGGSIV